MTLKELNYVLETMYGFKLWEKGRKRDVIYARKVFCQLAHKMGYGPTAMSRATGQPHDLMIYHRETFTSVLPVDIHHYNTCIDYFNLPLKKIEGINELVYGNEISEIIKKISTLGLKDLKHLKNVIIPNFKESIRFEKNIENMGRFNN